MRRKRNQSTAAAQKIMKERNYNLELIRMAAFLMVIAIHVTKLFLSCLRRSDDRGVSVCPCH